ncbi:hypothetical protein D3C72_2389500 [compost metagenome]
MTKAVVRTPSRSMIAAPKVSEISEPIDMPIMVRPSWLSVTPRWVWISGRRAISAPVVTANRKKQA